MWRSKVSLKAALSKSMSLDGLPQIRSTPLGEKLPDTFVSTAELRRALKIKRQTFADISQTTETMMSQSLAQMDQGLTLMEKQKMMRFHRVKKRKKRNMMGLERVQGLTSYEILQPGLKVYWERISNEEIQPGAREGASMVSACGKVILMGGSSRQIFSDIWVLLVDMEHWTKVDACSHEFIPRTGHSMVEFNRHVIIFGGQTSSFRLTNHRECLNSVAILNADVMDLKSVSTAGHSVIMRRYHCAAELGKHLVVHGGLTEKNQVLSDVIVLNMGSWKWRHVETEGDGPGSRAFHTAVGISNLGKGGGHGKIKEYGVYVFGGKDGDGRVYNSLHIIKLNTQPYTWTTPVTSGTPPEPRYHHTMSYFPELCIIVIYGGRQDSASESGYRCFGEVHMLHLDTLIWTTASIFGTPPESRCGHAAAALGSRLIIFGGIHNSHYSKNSTFSAELHQNMVTTMIQKDRDREEKKRQMELIRLRSQFELAADLDTTKNKRKNSSATQEKLNLGLLLLGVKKATGGQFSLLNLAKTGKKD